MEATNLAVFWASVIAVSILIYVILDGFDLGVGVLFGFTRDETNRLQMLNTIAPFWDGNETWLVIVGASLFAAFPAVYAVFVAFGTYYIYKLLREGPTGAAIPIPGATPNRPMAFADDAASATGTNLPGKR